LSSSEPLRPSWQAWEEVVVPPTPPYVGLPDRSDAVRRAIGGRVLHCYKKKRYEEQQEARIAAKDLNRYHPAEVPAESYHCRYCGGYHVGHEGKHRRVEGQAEA
jgi:hypothetical protein